MSEVFRKYPRAYNSLAAVLEQREVSSCVLEQVVSQSDYTEIPWKYKGNGLFMCCGRNHYKLLCVCLLSLTLYRLSFCYVFPLHSESESESATSDFV